MLFPAIICSLSLLEAEEQLNPSVSLQVQMLSSARSLDDDPDVMAVVEP